MVQGISRQVIVVQSPEPKMFEQAIFILKDEAVEKGVTDEVLLKQAQKVIRCGKPAKKRKLYLYGPVWACGGALVTAALWLTVSFL